LRVASRATARRAAVGMSVGCYASCKEKTMSATQFRLLRSALYLPASNQRAIEKSRSLLADVVIFDLEDAVAPDLKAMARANLIAAFGSGEAPGRSVRVIRVNAMDSRFLDDDLDTIGACRPDAVLLPKVSAEMDLVEFTRRMTDHGAGSVPALWCMIETAQGLTRLNDIVRAGLHAKPRLDCLIVGTNDIARETGVSLLEQRRYMVPWLMSIVLAAKANGVSVLDGVWNDFKNATGFEDEARQAQGMGFDGKTLIHPSQIDFANAAFAPSSQAVDDARAIVAAFADPANAGSGVINMDGRMVELLHLEMARRTLESAEAIRLSGNRS
jgi:citrate lyase subunit beta/citryl-CoA lyase